MDDTPHDDGSAAGPNDPNRSAQAPGRPGRPGENRFFDWMRGIGILRQNGWIGGVCGGLAARLGIDPLIVRGIVIVVAIFGGPMLFLYAVAWLLLPDATGHIHLERLFHGVFEPVIIAIGAIILFALLPFGRGFWWGGPASGFWGGGHWGSFGHVIWVLLVIAAIVGIVVWAVLGSRRSHGGYPWTDGQDAAGTPGAPGAGYGAAAASAQGAAAQGAEGQGAAGESTAAAGQHPAAGAAGEGASAAGATVPGAPVQPPPAPGADTNGEDYEAWRARQQQWKQDYAAWRAETEAAQRAEREQRSAAMREQARALAVEADAARRARRAANPRTSFAFVTITLGIALLAAGVLGIIAVNLPDWHGYEVTMGFAAASLTVGLAMMVAGTMRRRSGFLAFIAIVLSLITVCTVIPPRDRSLVGVNASYSDTHGARIFQPLGVYDVTLDRDDRTHSGQPPTVIDIDQWAGSVSVVSFDKRLSVRVLRTGGSGYLSGLRTNTDGSGSSPLSSSASTVAGEVTRRLSMGPAKSSPDVIVRVHQGVGAVNTAYQPENDTVTGSGTSASSEGAVQ